MDFVKGSRVLLVLAATTSLGCGVPGMPPSLGLPTSSSAADIPTSHSVQRYWRQSIDHLGVLADGFEFEIQAALRATGVGMRTSEVPTYEQARLGGVSKLNPMTDGLAILRIILSEASPRTGVRLAMARHAGRSRRFAHRFQMLGGSRLWIHVHEPHRCAGTAIAVDECDRRHSVHRRRRHRHPATSLSAPATGHFGSRVGKSRPQQPTQLMPSATFTTNASCRLLATCAAARCTAIRVLGDANRS